jgi:hypothetical protein
MKRCSPRILPRKRLADAPSAVVDLTRSYQKTARAGKEILCPARNL